MTELEQWFAQEGWTPFSFQRDTWRAWAAGESGLVHAPTGTGKTLAAWGGIVTEAAHQAPPPLSYLWITPLRALATDTTRNLNRPLEAIDAPWRVEQRTGDTSSSIRARQRRKPPPALVTTPESLSLLLTYADARERLARVRGVIVDEWHELLGSKRGVQLQLGLARLRAWNPGLRTWGLSATLGNLAEARDALLPAGAGGRLIRGVSPKRVDVDLVLPEDIERFPWAGHLGVRLLPQVLTAIEAARSTLLFTNTRSQAELWFSAIQACAPGWSTAVHLHHGSIDREERDRAEAALADGTARCVVATSSLDLGVDFSPVDQVIQVGSPKGVARLLQRAGRSGHQPGAVSRILCVPTHALEIVEAVAARRSIAAGRIEGRTVPKRCLDVLAQHVVTCALGGGFHAESLRDEARTCDAFRDLTDADWNWVLEYVTSGGTALRGYPEFQRVTRAADGRYVVASRRIATMHRMSVGTITSDAAIAVQWVKGGRLGHVEESFIARLKPGDRFLFSGRTLELVRVRDLVAQVRRARGRTGTVPRWQGGRLPLSTELADAVLDTFVGWDDLAVAHPELGTLAPLIDEQRSRSRLPAPTELLVEHCFSREGFHLFVYPFAGRLVHEGMAALLARRLNRQRPSTFSVTANDYGFELLTSRTDTWVRDEALLREALAPERLLADVRDTLNASEMARRRFREIARIAGLVFQGYPGRGKSTRQVQASSALIFDVLQRFDPDNPFLGQAESEVLEAELEYARLAATLEQLRQRRLVVIDTQRLTPLSFPLWADRVRQTLSTEDWQARVRRALDGLEGAA